MNFLTIKSRIINSLNVLVGKKGIVVVNSDVTISLKLTAKEINALKIHLNNKTFTNNIADDILQKILMQCTSTYYESEYEIFKVKIDQPETFDIKITPDGTVKID